MTTRRILALLPGLGLVVMAASPLHAQGVDASVVGAVRDSTGAPIAGARVEAADASTGFVLRVQTGASGRYALLHLPLGNAWRVRVSAVGYAPAERQQLALHIGDRRVVDFALAPLAVTAPDLVVIADRDAAARQGRIGGNSRIGERELSALPAVGRNFTDLAALSPLSGAQQSLGGQRYTATDIRLDGLQSRNLLRAGEYGGGPFTVSLEAIREFEVNTSVFDVADGRAGGGAISAVTRAGTNDWRTSAFTYHRDASLTAASDYRGRSRAARAFRTTQFGGSVAGPLKRDRLHLLLAYDGQSADEPLFTGLVETAADERVVGVARDSLARLSAILRASYGLDATNAQLGRLERRPNAHTVFGRLDWALAPAHRLTVRHNFSAWTSPLSGGVDQTIALREARSDLRTHEHQAFAHLSSTLGSGSHHELSLGLSTSRRALTPQSAAPRGFVRIRSVLADSSIGDLRVQFGGNRLAPDDSREVQVQWRQRLTVQRGAVALAVGMDHSLARAVTYIAESQSGLFEFNSLADLEQRRANRFSRAVPLIDRPTSRLTALELGAHAQAEWRPRPALALTGGLRWDASAVLSRPDANPLVAQAIGVRTDRAPADWSTVQPRLQLVIAPAGGRSALRVGAGLFSNQLPYYLHNNSLLHTGLSLTDIDLRTQIPTPDFPRYREDPSSIPGPPAGAAVAPPYVNVVSADLRSPTTWKATVAVEQRIGQRVSLIASMLASRTRGNYQYIDRNLVDTPAFRLGNEASRPVFVPAGSIDAVGRTDVRNALRVPSLSRVLELQNVGSASQLAATLEGTAAIGGGAFVGAAASWNRARDNSTYGCCLARTATTWTAIAGDPRDLVNAWAPSDLDFRYKTVLTFAAPSVLGIRTSGRYVGQTGRRFSLVVNTDINGDEAAGNDLAFLFDPADPATDPAVAAALRRLLANPENVARDYIAANLGTIAGRNAVAAPWTGRFDLRLAADVRLFRRLGLELTADCFNVLNLIDRDWGGQYLLPAGISQQNPALQRIPLLNVTGFDQATQRYRYSVNENAGVLAKQGDPYTIQLGVRTRF